jgi:hypothetical protein
MNTDSFLFRQHLCESHICPRCNITEETKEHILTCPDLKAKQQCQQHLQNMMTQLSSWNICPEILQALKGHLWRMLNLGFSEHKTNAIDGDNTTHT